MAKKKVELDRNNRYWKEFKEETFTGKCNWQYASVSDTSRLFRTVINKTDVLFDVYIDNKTNQPVYRISVPIKKISFHLEGNEGAIFERFLLDHCTHSSSVKTDKNCLNKTSVEYYAFKQAQAGLNVQAIKKKRKQESREKQRQEPKEKQSRELKKKRKALYIELYSTLLKIYKMPDGDVKIGMAILAEDRSGRLLQTVCGEPLPSSVESFSISMEQIIASIDPQSDITPDLRNLYANILNLYIEKRSQCSTDNVVLKRRTIAEYTTRIKKLQKEAGLKGNNHATSNDESAPHSDGIKTKEIKKHIRVNAHDFIIRRSVLSCMYKYHSVINVDAVITIVDRNRDFVELTVPAGYCQQCQKFFILESDYAQIATRGEPLCTVLDEKRYCENYKNERYFSEISAWPEKSILGKCGYSVSQTTGLSTLERRKILANVIDREILSKIEIRSHLKKQIALHERHPIAVDKWESDDDFVAAYNKGYYAKYGVIKLRRM